MQQSPLSPQRPAFIAFISALTLLVVSGVAAAVTIARLVQSQKWVIHTQQVQNAVGVVDSDTAAVGRARTGFVSTGNSEFLDQFEQRVRDVNHHIADIRELTRDNPEQQENCGRLEAAATARIAGFRQSIELRKRSPNDFQRQDALLFDGLTAASALTTVVEEMRGVEERLLASRQHKSDTLFLLAVGILAAAFILAVWFLSIYYQLLSTELRARQQAERMARGSEESLRILTARLLELQDEERRKFSRELHDSLGQYLAALKMNLDVISASYPDETRFQEAFHLLDESISETRTISHLLHPPLLDEAGFSSAARWYVEGFAQRSGIAVSVNLPDGVGRLPQQVELGLFRILQESLTNIHRHSGSARAEVALDLAPDRVSLHVRDYGKGIPAQRIANFREGGAGFGVGLSGMRERIRELGGQLEIQPNSPGTLISVTLPLKDTTRSMNAPPESRA